MMINIHGIIKAVLPDTRVLQRYFGWFKTSFVDKPDLIVEKKPSLELGGDLEGYGVYLSSKNKIVMKRSFGCISLEDLSGDTTTRLYYTGLTDKLYPIQNLVRDIIWFKLVWKGYTFIHSSAVVINGSGIAITGWLGSGKTMSSLMLVKNHGAGFLGDDMIILSRRGEIYSFPAPLKLSYPHSRVFGYPGYPARLKLLLGEPVSKIPVVRRRIELVEYADITSIAGDAGVPDKAPLSILLVARRGGRQGFKGLDAVKVSKQLFYQGLWERLYWVDRLFLHYSIANPEGFNLLSVLGEEENIISDALGKAEVFEVVYDKYLSEAVTEFLRNKGFIKS